jgi:hypothetical protein
MQPAISLSRKPAEFIGDFISPDYYQYLVKGYSRQHPTEEKSLFIPKSLILETLENFPNVSGLRFIYGQQKGANPNSRTIVLMPCNNTSAHKVIPNLILTPDGYMTHDGEQLSPDQCWDLFNRYVIRMGGLLPKEERKNLPRACFFGIDSLRSLLNTKHCGGIRYHFGYNSATEILSQRYQAVMEAVNKNEESLHVYMHTEQLCPTLYSSGPSGILPDIWILASLFAHKSLSADDSLSKDGAFYEMFHYTTPSLIEAIRQAGHNRHSDDQILQEQFSGSLFLLAEGMLQDAKTTCRIRLEALIKEYLFHN